MLKFLEKNKLLKEVIEWSLCILIAIVAALAIKYYIGTPTIVQQPSMSTTLMPNERLVLDKLSIHLGKELERGEIITFESPSKVFVQAAEADMDNPVAVYNREINGFFANLSYYVFETTKISYIKRVIAIAGDHIKIEEGQVFLNGELLEEPYLAEGVTTDSLDGMYTELVVPEDTVFVMGDNRAHSTDSRSFGCVPIDKVESKLFIRFWPLDKFGEV